MMAAVLLFVLSLFIAESMVKATIPRNEDRSLPNFVIMLMDDMGWGDLGCNGEPNRETPYLDQMSLKGMTVSSMYTSNPLCSPSYTPQEIVGGIQHSEILLSELLRQKNYTNVLIGKWHLGHQEQYLPLARGFDHFFGSTNCHFGPYDDVHTPNIPLFRDDRMIGRYHEDFLIDRSTGESNMTRLYTEEAVRFIESRRRQSDPFFLLWAPDATHAPTFASKQFLKSSRRGTYGAAVVELDIGVGAILKALKDAGLSNNTLVVFTSDNGAALVSKTDGGSSGPFLCGKQTTFEGGMRAPGIFYWPGTIPSETISHQVWTQMDLFSTLLELAGIDLPNDRFLDGLPLSRFLTNPHLAFPRPVFFYRGNRLMAVRMGAYKMHLWTWHTTSEELDKGIDYCPGQRMKNVTTTVPFDHRDQPLLYNVEADPSERYPISPSSDEYKSHIDQLLDVATKHENDMVPGTPQLNWCDTAVMHWAPPGCEEIDECLPRPESSPYLCDWPH